MKHTADNVQASEGYPLSSVPGATNTTRMTREKPAKYATATADLGFHSAWGCPNPVRRQAVQVSYASDETENLQAKWLKLVGDHECRVDLAMPTGHHLQSSSILSGVKFIQDFPGPAKPWLS